MSNETTDDMQIVQQVIKKSNKKLFLIIIAVVLVLIAAMAVYFIQMEASLEKKLDEGDFVSAASTAKLMPWLFITSPELNSYLAAQDAFANGNAEAAAKLLKPLGGYRDATDLYIKAETVARLEAISDESNADELVAALIKLDEINLADTKYSQLVDRLYTISYDKAKQIIIEDAKRSKALFEALPIDYQDVKTKVQIANIYYDFQTNDSEEIYEESFAKLRSFITDDTAKVLLTSKYFIPMLLEGKWETADGEYYFEQTNISYKEGTGTHKTNLPKDTKYVAAEYDDASMYVMAEGADTAELMYSFECVDMNTIKITNAADGKTYEMTRK